MKSRDVNVKTKEFPFTRRKLCSLILIIGLLCSAFFAGQAVGQSGIGNQNYPTAYNSGGPTGAYDYLIFTFENSTDTYYAAKDSFGRIVDSWTSTDSQTVFDSVSALSNVAVVVAAGSYSATLEVPDGMSLTLRQGVSGVTYTIAYSASCTINDEPNGKQYIIEDGAVIGGNSHITAFIDTIVSKQNGVLIDEARELVGMFYNARYNRYGAPLFDFGSGVIERATANGTLEHIGVFNTTDKGSIIKFVLQSDINDRWLIWATTNSTPWASGTAYFYSAQSDITIDDEYRKLENTYPPHYIDSALYITGPSSTPYFFWAEYTTVTPTPETLSIIRVQANDGTFERVLNVSTTDIRHFHSLDADPYNPGHLYATTGDNNENVRWYKSEDYGTSWTEIANGSQAYRTLRISFTEDYIYWASDGYVDGYARLYRASRSDVTNFTDLFALPQNILSYGITRVFTPEGILITTYSDATPHPDSAPLFFYDFLTGLTHKVLSKEITSAGWRVCSPYQFRATGNVYLQIIYMTEFELYPGDITPKVVTLKFR